MGWGRWELLYDDTKGTTASNGRDTSSLCQCERIMGKLGINNFSDSSQQ